MAASRQRTLLIGVLAVAGGALGWDRYVGSPRQVAADGGAVHSDLLVQPAGGRRRPDGAERDAASGRESIRRRLEAFATRQAIDLDALPDAFGPLGGTAQPPPPVAIAAPEEPAAPGPDPLEFSGSHR